MSPGFIDELNKTLQQREYQRILKFPMKTRDISGGFILKSGDIELNNSFEAIIRMHRDDIEPEVIKTLF